MKYLLTITFLIITLSTNAEIITDGTLGQKINLPGPNFQITPDLGQQHGGNLFHSFQDFNLNSLESATFSGPNSVNNIISRVTGGNPSLINGLIRSTIPNADMYFLNPYGIMFGPNAQLDVQGSFHASTADYLRLGENGRFDARYPSDSLLTIAPIESFGFLTNSPATITTQDSNLSVSEGKTLSLIGGNLDLSGSTPPLRLNAEGSVVIPSTSVLSASSGRINLVSVASEGEILPNPLGLNNTNGGQIKIDKSLVDVSGQGNGSIFIRSKNLIVVNGSQIQAKKQVLSKNNPKLPDSNESQEAGINIEVKTLSFDKKSYISADSFTTENSGDIIIKANDISFRDGWISNRAFSTGNSGNITLIADNILLEDGGIITLTYHTGDAGDINIKANEVVTITGANSKGGWNSGLVSISYAIHENVTSGIGGDIILEAKELILTKGGNINSNTVAKKNMQSNQAGNIDIKVSDNIRISGVNPYGENESGLGSSINASSNGLNAGNAGTISLTAKALYIIDGAEVIANTSGLGQGGNINLNITEQISISGDSSHIILKEPKYSQLVFQENFPHHNDRISISGIYANSLNNSNDAGNAGNINILADQIILGHNNKIATETENATGGNINIGTSTLSYLNSGQIVTSVYGGIGDGGNITIENPTFVVLKQGQIKAQANEGHGGNIHIKSKYFINSPDSLVSASSKLGLDGEIAIDSPDMDMAGFLVILSGDVVDPSSLIQKPCRMRGSSFTVQKINGSPQTPYDYQPARYLPETNSKATKISMNLEEKRASSTCKEF